MSVTNVETKRRPGRPYLLGRPMTAKERNARHREKTRGKRPPETLAKGIIAAGQVWEIGRGLNMKPAIGTVVSISAMGLWGPSGFRVYLTNNKTGRLLNVGHYRMTTGLDCRRLS